MVTTDRSLIARIGGYALAAAHDSRETTANGRAAFLAKFEHEVDPNGVLTVTERERRATALRNAHFARMALKSAQARRKVKS